MQIPGSISLYPTAPGNLNTTPRSVPNPDTLNNAQVSGVQGAEQIENLETPQNSVTASTESNEGNGTDQTRTSASVFVPPNTGQNEFGEEQTIDIESPQGALQQRIEGLFAEEGESSRLVDVSI